MTQSKRVGAPIRAIRFRQMTNKINVFQSNPFSRTLGPAKILLLPSTHGCTQSRVGAREVKTKSSQVNFENRIYKNLTKFKLFCSKGPTYNTIPKKKVLKPPGPSSTFSTRVPLWAQLNNKCFTFLNQMTLC